MQTQAVPLINPDLPIVSTGMEAYAAVDSGQVLVAEETVKWFPSPGVKLFENQQWVKKIQSTKVSTLQSEHLYRSATSG